jgi:hypothetical protein
MEMATLLRCNFPVKIVVLNNGGIVGLQPTDLIRGPGMPEIPGNPMFGMKPNAPIDGARYGRVMETFGGTRALCREPEGHPRRPRRGVVISRRAPPGSRNNFAGRADRLTSQEVAQKERPPFGVEPAIAHSVRSLP